MALEELAQLGLEQLLLVLRESARVLLVLLVEVLQYHELLLFVQLIESDYVFLILLLSLRFASASLVFLIAKSAARHVCTPAARARRPAATSQSSKQLGLIVLFDNVAALGLLTLAVKFSLHGPRRIVFLLLKKLLELLLRGGSVARVFFFLFLLGRL